MSIERSKRSHRSKLLSDGIASTLIALLVKLRGLLLLPIISRSAGIADYGVWVQVTMLIGLVPPFFGLNVHQSLTRYVAGKTGPSGFAIYRRLLAFVVPLSAGMGILAAAVAYYFVAEDAASRTISLLCALLVPAIALNKLSVAYVRGRGEVKLAYSLDAALNVLSFAGSAAAFALGLGIIGGVSALVLVYCFFSLVVAYRHFQRRPAVMPGDQTRLSEYVLYSLPTIPAALADWVLFGVDRYVIAYFVSNAAVGVYAACYSLATALLLFSVPVEYALMPLISELWERGDRPGAMRLTKDALAYVGVPSLLGAVLLVKDGPWVLQALSGAALSNDARRLLLFVAPGLFLWSLTRVLFQVYFGKKRTADMATTLLAAAVVNVSVNLLLVPRLGSVGAAVATAVAYALTLCVTLVRLRSDLALAPSSVRFWGIGAAVVAPCGVALLLPAAGSWLSVFIDGIACAVAMALALVLTRSLPVRELMARRQRTRDARSGEATSS